MTAKWDGNFFLGLGCAYLCALGLEMFCLDFLGIFDEYSFSTTAFACAAAMMILLLMTYRFKVVLALLAGLVLPVTALFVFTDTPEYIYDFISRFFVWFGPFLKGSAVSRPAFSLTFFIASVSIISLTCYIFVCIWENVLAMFLLTALPVLALSFLSRRGTTYALLLFTAFGLILLFTLTAKSRRIEALDTSVPHIGFWQTLPGIIPLVLTGLAAASILSYSVPASDLRSQKVADTTNDILSFCHIPLPDTAGRNIFNLGGMGYYPLHDRLGGPAQVSDNEVMDVTSSSDLLLRAGSYNIYNTQYWSSSNSVFSSRFHSAALSASTADFFDMNRPNASEIPAGLIDAVLQKETITIENLSSQVGGTMFTADHVLDVTAKNRTVFYNQSGETFLSPSVAIGQSYTVTFSHFRTSSATYRQDLLALEAYITAHPESGDTNRKMLSITEEYLAADVPDAVREYGLSITAGASTPLEKVFAIRQELLTNYTYALDVDVPPEDSDFVEYFINTKKGYCTYFASAMAVLARINGIPSRYVEGFVVDVPDTSDGAESTVTVTGRSGHAWCEVYMNGIGWIPIDATAGPSGSGTALSEENTAAAETPIDSPSAYTPPDQGYHPTGTAVTGVPRAAAEDFSSAAGRFMSKLVLPLVFTAVLLSAALSALFARRWKRHFSLKPFDELVSSEPPEDRMLYLWELSQNHLHLLSIRINPADTAVDFADRMRAVPVYVPGCRKDTYNFDLVLLAGLHDKWIYGRHAPSEEELSRAYVACGLLIGQVRGAHKSRFTYLLHFIMRSGKK